MATTVQPSLWCWGDGRELHRSPLVKDHQLRKAEVDVTGVEVLGLSVEDGGDGVRNDWGVWISPQVKQDAETERRAAGVSPSVFRMPDICARSSQYHLR